MLNNDPYIIAEMSANHAGKLENALAIVQAAKEAGADCLKIQSYTPDSITLDCENEYFQIKNGLWEGYNLYNLYKEASLPKEWQIKIKNECDKAGVDFLSTVFDEQAVDFLDELGVNAFKIASFELVDLPLIRYAAKKGKSMIVSTGLGSLEEIEDAVNAITEEGLQKEQIVLLICTSEYPADISDMNLLTISDIQKRFGVRTGLSDHSTGIIAPVTAAALGANVIEKHFCFSRKIKSPDCEFSLEPVEFAQMVKAVREAAAARGQVFYGATASEKKNLVFRRSIFAVKDINEGEMFTRENIRVIRPAYGIKPKYINLLQGKKSVKNYLRGEPICKDELCNLV